MPVTDYREPTNGAAYEVATVSLAVQAMHQAFAAHVPLSLRPDTLWYFIAHEVAEYVRQNPDTCASLFTDTPESKQTITVRDDSLRYDGPSDWQRSINLVRDPLAAKVSDHTMGLFLPRFTTSTSEDETALLVALMDADGLAREFAGLSGYFTDLLPVLQTIAETSAGSPPDEDFWRSIYKYGGGSGGPFVTGWMTAFFAFIQTNTGPTIKDKFDWAGATRSGWGGYRTNKFPSHVTKVPFVWDYLGTNYEMALVAGVTGVDFEEEFLSPRLGFAVIEV